MDVRVFFFPKEVIVWIFTIIICNNGGEVEIKKFVLWCSSLCAIGMNEMLVHKDEHLCYAVQMINVEVRNRMDMDHFSPLSSGEQLPIPVLLCFSCKEFPLTSVKKRRHC